MSKIKNLVMTRPLFVPGIPQFKDQLNQQQYPGIQMSYAAGGVRCFYKDHQFLVPFSSIVVIVEEETVKEGKVHVETSPKAA